MIEASGNGYVVKVKGNQGRLLRALQKIVQDGTPQQTDYQEQRTRGRLEQRRVSVYRAQAGQNGIAEDWPGLRCLIYVERSGQRDGAPYYKDGYYISNRSLKAHEFACLIRGHWLIENQLHWVKDVTLGEDRCGIAHTNAAANLSVLKTIMINVYRRAGYHSIKAATEQFANNIKELVNLIRT